MILIVHCDGGARGNPGPAAIGVTIEDAQGKLIHQFGKRIGETTNNVAEYTAVIEALDYIAKELHVGKQDSISFHLDSQLVVSQLNGIYRVKDPKLRMLLLRVREKEGVLGIPISYRHIPREQNRGADKMVNAALDNSPA